MCQFPYPNLFSPIEIGGVRLRNRVVASAHCGPQAVFPGRGDYDAISSIAAQYMGQLARGGAAVVNTGHYGVDPRYQLGALRYAVDFFSDRIHNDQLSTLHLMSDTVQAYGALASIELNHGGYMSTPFGDNKLIGPMDMTLPDGREVVGMDRAEMDRVVEYFANAVRLARLGGFDIINVHAAHNWLLGQFFSPILNKREDEFGGSVENRCRFPLMVLKAIREELGPHMLLSVRYSAAELVKGGATMEETVAAIKLIADYAHIVHCSAGKVDNVQSSNFTFPSQYTHHGINAYLAREVKRQVPNIFVEAIGGINDPAMAEQFISDGTCDLVAMARSFIADNDWARKAKDGHAEDIRPCIRCLRCLGESYNFKGHRPCSVNPRRTLYQELQPSELPQVHKKVVVVGGGPAGLQAANELALKGHEVVLFEKDGKLGGRLSFADHVAFKEDIGRYRDYLITQVGKRENVTVRLNEEATPEKVKAEAPDAVVVAIGAENFVPPIPGAELPGVLHCSDLFGQEDKVGSHAVIIGGGAVGCEAAIQLQDMGRSIDLVEMEDALMKTEIEDYPDQRDFTLYYVTHELHMDSPTTVDLPERDTCAIHLRSRCVEIRKDGVEIEGPDGARSFLPADTVILATGVRPNKALNARFEGLARDVIFIGDCMRPGTLYNTSTTGYYAALQI